MIGERGAETKPEERETLLDVGRAPLVTATKTKRCWILCASLAVLALIATVVTWHFGNAQKEGLLKSRLENGSEIKAFGWITFRNPFTGNRVYLNPFHQQYPPSAPQPAAPQPAWPQPATLQPATSGQCPGTIFVLGHGPVSLVNARWNTPGSSARQVQVGQGVIVPHLGGRAYFGNSCTTGTYNPLQYSQLMLLGRTLHYTTDLSGAECGCNAALYLTSLHQNSAPSSCGDYYCDANSVCGVACAEIDIQEANKHAWDSTLHVHDDGSGRFGGYGGDSRRDWTAAEYGPGARCIDTNRPFQVAASFPVNGAGMLQAMVVTLSQMGHSCRLTVKIDSYNWAGRDGMAELSATLARGMTPIISYWKSTNMLWMDGKGGDGKGPCAADTPQQCADTVRFSGFSLS